MHVCSIKFEQPCSWSFNKTITFSKIPNDQRIAPCRTEVSMSQLIRCTKPCILYEDFYLKKSLLSSSCFNRKQESFALTPTFHGFEWPRNRSPQGSCAFVALCQLIGHLNMSFAQKYNKSQISKCLLCCTLTERCMISPKYITILL